jgi:hypothetical protein
MSVSRRNYVACCLLSMTVLLGWTPPQRAWGEGISPPAEQDEFRRVDDLAPAIRALRTFHSIVFVRPERRISRSDAAILGYMDQWMDVPNFRRVQQQVLSRTPYRRLVGWTSSGRDLAGFETLWVIEDADGNQFLLWADDGNEQVFVAMTLSPEISLSPEDRETLQDFWKKAADFVDASRIEGRDQQLGGTVTLLMIADEESERFLFSFGFVNEKDWEPLFRARKSVVTLLQQRLNQRFPPEPQEGKRDHEAGNEEKTVRRPPADK